MLPTVGATLAVDSVVTSMSGSGGKRVFDALAAGNGYFKLNGLPLGAFGTNAGEGAALSC